MSELSITPQTEAATPAPTPPSPTQAAVPDHKDNMPPALYREAGRMPHLLELIPSGEFAYKTFNVKELSELVDDYLNSKTQTKEGYAAELKTLMKRAGAEENDVYIAIDRLAEFVRIENKISQAIQDKEELEKKPISDMTVKELRIRLLGEEDTGIWEAPARELDPKDTRESTRITERLERAVSEREELDNPGRIHSDELRKHLRG